MPLHISEIGVRMAVGEAGDTQGEAAAGSHAATPAPAGLSPDQFEAIVQESVRRVLATLRTTEAR